MATEPEGGSAADYDPLVTTALRAEAVRIMRAFGFAGAHVIVVGGLVPSLLVPKPEVGIERHVGTLDLDVCLTVALVEGEVGSYERLEVALRGAGFDMVREGEKTVSWRWRGGKGLPVTLEFFCPAAVGREAGKLYRPGGVVGGKLSAMTLATGRLLDRDHRRVEVEVDLPDGGGRTRHALEVAGPAAYLASKVDALRRRDKNKDAYDLVWLAEGWPGGQRALAIEIRASSIWGDPEFIQALQALREEFANVDASGAVKYARFMRSDEGDFDQLARQAVGAVRELLDALVKDSAPRGAG